MKHEDATDVPVTAFLCPGQGAQSADMADLILGNAKASSLLDVASDLIGENLGNFSDRDATYYSRNEISAVLVSLASISANEKLLETFPPADFYAGYSVGQWTAMHLAGMLCAEDLIQVLITRARMMNTTRAVGGGSMLAVIGLPKDKVKEVLQEIEGYIIIANDNAPGQFTLAGEHSAIDDVEARLAPLNPQRLLRIPVAGAWHSDMVSEAREPFEKFLETLSLNNPRVPVISNVTGKPLPQDPSTLRLELGAHICSPVRWADSIRYLIEQDVTRFVEVGYEQTLSKFGFFIDRSRQHMSWSRLISA